MQWSEKGFVYIPFWEVQNYLDASTHDPFIKGKVLKQYFAKQVGSAGSVEVCDFEIKIGLVAYSVPVSKLIAFEELEHWANTLGKWISEYPNRQKHSDG